MAGIFAAATTPDQKAGLACRMIIDQGQLISKEKYFEQAATTPIALSFFPICSTYGIDLHFGTTKPFSIPGPFQFQFFHLELQSHIYRQGCPVGIRGIKSKQILLKKIQNKLVSSLVACYYSLGTQNKFWPSLVGCLHKTLKPLYKSRPQCSLSGFRNKKRIHVPCTIRRTLIYGSFILLATILTTKGETKVG